MTTSPHDILSLVYFARVVQEKSFTGAAAKLGVSKSVVSGRISALEHRLKVRLLNRTTRKLSLTPEGLSLFEHCGPLLRAVEAATQAVAGAGDSPRGLLRVNAPVVFAQEYLAAPMADYLQKFPEMRIELSLNDKVVDLVEEGIDVAIRISPLVKDGGLVARKLAVDGTVLCASPAYLARKGTPERPEDLVHHDCLIYSLLKVADEWRFRGRRAGETVTVPVEGRFRAGSGAVLVRAALAGMGLAVLPTFMIASELATGKLRRVIDSFVGVNLSIFAVYPHAPQSSRPPPKVRAFVDLLVATFREPPWRTPRASPSNRAAARRE